MSFPDPLGGAIERRIDALERERIVQRIWERDHTVWRPDPDQIADRLGWLTVAEALQPRASELRAIGQQIASEGFERAVLLGMGGSSLAAETMRRILGVASDAVDLVVLDSTHPAAVARVETSGDLRRTLFVVASKSGTTVETLSHLQYFYARIQRGDHFMAITDPGTPLASLAESHGFRGVFLNAPDIGGRYSALSLFGLVPAALIGADIDELLSGAIDMATACRGPAAGNPAALLGAAMGEAAAAGRDKATFALPDDLQPLGPWIEQLIAESTGKEGRGIVPVVGERPGDPSVYGKDRLFVALGAHPWLDAAAHPVVHVDPSPLGGEFFRFELATAIAGHVLGIQPFDQPNVAQAKEATAAILSSGGPRDPGFDDPGDVLDPPPDYLAILAYVDPSVENADAIEQARVALRDRLRVPVTAGFGPRYLHSTGQLHKGGAAGGGFLMVADATRSADAMIPGRGFTFGTLIDAQAQGDLTSLRSLGRRVARIRMQDLAALA